MARGQPDFGMYAPKTVGATLADMGELAARLGSIDTYDRRGDIVLLDDFEGPVLKWVKALTAPTYIILDSTTVRSGSQAVKIHTRAVAGAAPGMNRTLFTLGSGRLGHEVHFSNPSATLRFRIYIDHHTGTEVRRAYAQINFTTGELRVTTLAGAAYTVATGLTFPSANFCFIPFKLVMDFDTNKYVRVLLGNVEYDISTIDIQIYGVGESAREVVVVEVYNNAAAEGEIWVDDVIITQNEP